MSFQRLAPNASDLQTGDLVWPRAGWQIVSFDDDRTRSQPWHVAYAQEIAKPGISSEETEQLDLFVRDIWVGHIALIEIVDGIPWVVDATPNRSGWAEPRTDGVAMQPYQAFLDDAAHTESHIWHGRIKPEFVNPADNFGQRLVDAAKKHIGAKYSIKPRGLAKPNKFYCSKLIWHALRDGLGITLEKKGLRVPQPWFTPWDVMQADCVQLLYQPAGKSYRG
jgi:Permuted papain-like amidase enzyme, YaeF/YiiX, C92 family